MNRKIVSIIFLILAIFISLALGSYKFLVSNKPASLPPFVETFKEGVTTNKKKIIKPNAKPQKAAIVEHNVKPKTGSNIEPNAKPISLNPTPFTPNTIEDSMKPKVFKANM